MDALKRTRRHTCKHCQQEVLTVEGCRTFGAGDTTKWRLPLKHCPSAVEKAASCGCPFFVWLWEQLRVSGTPPEQMKRTTIILELEATKFRGWEWKYWACHPSLRFYFPGREPSDITGCTIKVETRDYTWVPAKFDVMSDWDDASAQYAVVRAIDGHTSSSLATAQIRSRLAYCRAFHDDCMASPVSIRPYRFVSVPQSSNEDLSVKVVCAPSLYNENAEPYAALSYCWGKDHTKIFKTTLANKKDVEASLPVRLLPQSIQDAIDLTRQLGINLLWVDSLCLVQDDEEELAKETAKMHHYYRNATVTISAATSVSCTQGFRQDKPLSYTSEDDILGPFYFPVDIEIPERHRWTRVLPTSQLKWPSWLKWPSESRRLHRLKFVVRSSPMEPIDSRAWTLQEALLSRRLVSFGSRTISWSCQTDSYGTDKNIHLRNSLRLLQSDISNNSRCPNTSHLKLWCTLVENYTARALSNQQDRLPAISGIASMFYRSQFERDYLVHEQQTASAGHTANGDANASEQLSGIFPRQAPTSLSRPLETLCSISGVEQPSSTEHLMPMGDEHYAAGLLDSSIPMITRREGRGGEEMIRIPEIIWNGGEPEFPLEYNSRLLVLQLLWTPREMDTRNQGQSAQPSPSYVAPSWSWASHSGAVDTHITRIDDKLMDKLQFAIWAAGFRVREVRTVPMSPEAPFGALSSGSLTIESAAIPLSDDRYKNTRVALDSEGQGPFDYSCSDLICLQVIPDLRGLQAKDLSQLHGVPHGLVLEIVDHRCHSRSCKVFRRVGVYYADYPDIGPGEGSEDVETDTEVTEIPLSQYRDLLKQRPDLAGNEHENVEGGYKKVPNRSEHERIKII